MAPFFDGIKSFADVPTEPGIDTLQVRLAYASKS